MVRELKDFERRHSTPVERLRNMVVAQEKAKKAASSGSE